MSNEKVAELITVLNGMKSSDALEALFHGIVIVAEASEMTPDELSNIFDVVLDEYERAFGHAATRDAQ